LRKVNQSEVEHIIVASTYITSSLRTRERELRIES
jgi:hypothetical protein